MAFVCGSDLRQLTDGPYNEIDPRSMPDGRIMFVSERRGGFPRSRWWPGPSHTLHVMDRDGANIRRLSRYLSLGATNPLLHLRQRSRTESQIRKDPICC